MLICLFSIFLYYQAKKPSLMSSTSEFVSILLTALMVVFVQPLHAQEKLSRFDDYTGEMQIGSDSYRYDFTNVEGNDCKLKFEQWVTDKKGATEVSSWIFYLSDIDPSGISFKAKGKSIIISMKTLQSQKFITYYEDGEINGYTEKIEITMNEVAMTRSFIDAIKEKIANCKDTQALWENRDQSFTWLVNNVEKATDKEVSWDQKFKQGSRNYIVNFQANSTNKKGEQKLFSYIFDLSDINSMAINLKISGKSLIIELPVKEGKRYIQVVTPAGTSFTDELMIYADNIELARQVFNALKYLITNTISERPTWDSYKASLGFVKDHLGEVLIGDDQYFNSLNFEASASGLVNFVIGRPDSDGTQKSITYAFYLADIMDTPKLEVSKSSITIKLETKNKHEYIREMEEEKVTDYTSSLGFHVSDVDMARNIQSAFEHAIRNSDEKIEEFSNIGEVSSWFSENIGTIETDGGKLGQQLSIIMENENQVVIEKKLTKADGASTETRYMLYPEDINLDKLDIKVSGKKLSVNLSSGTYKYIKNFKNELLQDFTGSVEIQFSNPLLAKNFIAAIRFLKENSLAEDRKGISKEEAMSFLSRHIQSIKLPDKQYAQILESLDEENCKMGFTRVEIGAKKSSMEYLYEFIGSDIHPGSSKLSVKGDLILINLVTVGNNKLIKPYKNGEAGDFVDDFVIYADDVLVAKKILAAFGVLSEGCQ